MNSAKKPANKCTVILLCATVLLSGCTVVPKVTKSSQASWDQGGQNSGIITMTADHTLVVTPHLRERYDALIALFGNQFHPALTPDYGVTPTATNTFLMTPDAFEHFAAMNRWHKQAAPPWVK